MHEINSLEEFRKVKRDKIGYVLIIDTPNGIQRIHHSTCPHVDERNFTSKVITNEKSNGRYFWTDTVSIAKSRFGMVDWCSICRRNKDER